MGEYKWHGRDSRIRNIRGKIRFIFILDEVAGRRQDPAVSQGIDTQPKVPVENV